MATWRQNSGRVSSRSSPTDRPKVRTGCAASAKPRMRSCAVPNITWLESPFLPAEAVRMLNRRDFLVRSLKTSTLLAVGPAVPGFLARTAHAAEPGKDSVLVVVELSGGNDGLNT